MEVGAGNNCFSFSLSVWGLHFVADSFLGGWSGSPVWCGSWLSWCSYAGFAIASCS